jgi:hypothetical protein
MTTSLQAMIEAAKRVKTSAAAREEHRRSFVFGNTAFGNERITREMIDREADKLSEEQNAKRGK